MLAKKPLKVAVVGQGYTGLPLAIRCAEVGHDVVGFDADMRRVKDMNAGESHVDDVPNPRLAAALNSGRFHPSADHVDLAGMDIYIICVPTPLLNGVPDLEAIENAARTVAGHINKGCTVVLESTTYPGTTADFLRPLLEVASGLIAARDFYLGYSPERIDPGNRQWNLVNTPKLVSGIDSHSLEHIDSFYSTIVDQTVTVSDTQTAELAKALENTFRQVNIALMNELATVSRHLGANVWEAVDAAATKPFGYLPFTPGPGVGGHCLTTDPIYLSWRVAQRAGDGLRLVDLANDINSRMPGHVVQRVIDGLAARGKAIEQSRILLLGLAFKKNSSDLRDSPALEIAQGLLTSGADIRAAEPIAPPELIPVDVHLVAATKQEIAGADAVVILADHDAFDYRLVEEFGRYVLDTRNRCQGSQIELL